MDEFDFYTKSEVNEKFGIETTEDTGRDFYTKAEIIEKVGTPETLVLPADMLDFYTKTEIDSIPTTPPAPSYDETKINLIRVTSDGEPFEPSEILYPSTLKDANNIISAGDGRYWHLYIGSQTGLTALNSQNYIASSTGVIITLNEGLTTIGSWGIMYSNYLKRLIIPSTVTSINSSGIMNVTTRGNPTIEVRKPEYSISGAPWGASDATIIWTG